MAPKPNGGPAFPAPAQPKTDWSLEDVTSGMSLRDWFAGQAMALAHADYAKGVPEYDLKAMFGNRGCLRKEEIVAAIAARYADAMLAERSKP